MRGFRSSNNRSAAGAYEAPSRGAAGRRGFGPLDPDEAWDSRVGHEADAGGYYGFEEQELGLRGRSMDLDHGRYGGADYEMNMPRPGDGDRGRTMSRSPGVGGGALNVPGGAHHGGGNPFDDDAEPSNISMRGVSPRPIDTGVGAAAVAHKKMAGQTGDSPTSVNTERRSIFRENV
ncbi:hypothetical protein F5Y15DRAFT_400093 [Xylariaceae sp. FL0016]|nr:hypothetical protein F5Y15DRAFT_400093 [Xylariaceae sp. FL0016]